jgi:hypothetical protein
LASSGVNHHIGIEGIEDGLVMQTNPVTRGAAAPSGWSVSPVTLAPLTILTKGSSFAARRRRASKNGRRQ